MKTRATPKIKVTRAKNIRELLVQYEAMFKKVVMLEKWVNELALAISKRPDAAPIIIVDRPQLQPIEQPDPTAPPGHIYIGDPISPTFTCDSNPSSAAFQSAVKSLFQPKPEPPNFGV